MVEVCCCLSTYALGMDRFSYNSKPFDAEHFVLNNVSNKSYFLIVMQNFVTRSIQIIKIISERFLFAYAFAVRDRDRLSKKNSYRCFYLRMSKFIVDFSDKVAFCASFHSSGKEHYDESWLLSVDSLKKSLDFPIPDFIGFVHSAIGANIVELQCFNVLKLLARQSTIFITE